MSVSFHLPETLSEGRALLDIDIALAKRKQLGQCFTGLQTGRLLAAIAVHSGQKRIADPMAGHGDLLESAAERANYLKLSSDELVGVEIESEAARLGKWRVERCKQEFGFKRGHFIHGDSFAIPTWNGFNQFDLVITNPPYVRYQSLSKRTKETNIKLLDAKGTRNALEQLALKLAPQEERQIWQCLIRSYSGLADLSLPSWLLCGLLTAPSGILALVIPQTWLNRDYAKLARYFFLRFFQPLAIIQESGQRWFQDVLVPVSLVVGRRLPTEQAILPLQKRRSVTFGNTVFAEISSEASSNDSHVGKAFTGNDPEGEFAKWLQSGKNTRFGIKMKRVLWESQRDEVLTISRRERWIQSLEGDFSSKFFVESSKITLPTSIASYLPSDFLKNTRVLCTQPIGVGQGLRTGCNDFFYVNLEENIKNGGGSVSVLTSDLFNRQRLTVPASVLKPVFRKQSEILNMQIDARSLRGRLLDLREFILPENCALLPKHFKVIPKALAEYVRQATRTYLIRGENRTLIPCLSAVKTNGIGPNETTKFSLRDPKYKMRMWYMIPDFSQRHIPSLCVPRIIHDKPSAILNSKQPILIDANFSTIWCVDNSLSPEILFAILNSSWGELCMEALGATLGGGALKLEATHLRQMPIPILSAPVKVRLHRIVREALDSPCTIDGFQRYRSKIDQVIICAMMDRVIVESKTNAYIEMFAGLIQSLRAKRRKTISQ